MNDVNSQLNQVESQLSLLMKDLQQLETETLREKAPQKNLENLGYKSDVLDKWETSLEDFHVKATTIRRILGKFLEADLPTRRYLRHHLDEEFAQLRLTYKSLREHFATATEREENKDGLI